MRVVRLSSMFYEKYADCPEIMQKPKRPYYCLEVRVREKTFAIPFRHHIKHQYAFYTVADAGLDYTKAVLITDDAMISDDVVRVDTAEWRLINRNEDMIFSGFVKYLRLYEKAKKKTSVPKYKKIVEFSALQYFDL